MNFKFLKREVSRIAEELNFLDRNYAEKIWNENKDFFTESATTSYKYNAIIYSVLSKIPKLMEETNSSEKLHSFCYQYIYEKMSKIDWQNEKRKNKNEL